MKARNKDVLTCQHSLTSHFYWPKPSPTSNILHYSRTLLQVHKYDIWTLRYTYGSLCNIYALYILDFGATCIINYPCAESASVYLCLNKPHRLIMCGATRKFVLVARGWDRFTLCPKWLFTLLSFGGVLWRGAPYSSFTLFALLDPVALCDLIVAFAIALANPK